MDGAVAGLTRHGLGLTRANSPGSRNPLAKALCGLLASPATTAPGQPPNRWLTAPSRGDGFSFTDEDWRERHDILKGRHLNVKGKPGFDENANYRAPL